VSDRSERPVRGVVARPGSSASISRAERRRQVVAFATIAGLVVLAFGLWSVAILTSSDPNRLEIAAEGAPSDANENDASTDGPIEGGSDLADDPDGSTPDSASGTDDALGERSEVERGAEVEPVTIDGVCTVEIDAGSDAESLRAWDFPDCAYAPVTIEDQRERWIVIRASMSSDDFDGQAAEKRAEALGVDAGVDGGVLWSSHYPSLNPDLWVVYEGPFAGAEAARGAADAADGEAYARVLTTDDADRFCIADDGCVGERAD
jgi:hypothetical protein